MAFTVAAIVGALLVLFVIVGAIVFKGGVSGRTFYIPSQAMVPTLQQDDRVHATPLDDDDAIERGQIIIFDRPPLETDTSIEFLTKRVVGLPGETIESRDGKVFINGEPLAESYLGPETLTDGLPVTVVPASSYFVMGDNRTDSFDSRAFAPIERSLIKYRVDKIIYPLGRRTDLP